MWRQFSLLIVGLLLATGLAACANDKEEGGNDTAQPAALIEPSQVSQYLLTLEDMPTGWAASPDDEEDEQDDDTTVFCLERPDDLPKSAANKLVIFSKAATGPYILHAIGVFATREEAKARYDFEKQAVEQCPKWTETNEDGEEVEYTLSAVSFPRYGEDSLTFRLTGDGFEFDFTMVLNQNVLSRITVGQLLGFGDAPEDGLHEQLVQKAMAKLPE